MKKYSFQIKESEIITIQFYCETENERDEWINKIKSAISHKKTQVLESKTLILPSNKQFCSYVNNTTAYHYNETVETPMSAIDFPRKSEFFVLLLCVLCL